MVVDILVLTEIDNWVAE